jgi:hypothetical protein
MTVLVQTGTRSTVVLVFMTVTGTISVTHVNSGAGGASTHGFRLQESHAEEVLAANATANAVAISQLGGNLMADKLQGEEAAVHWNAVASMLRDREQLKLTTKIRVSVRIHNQFGG